MMYKQPNNEVLKFLLQWNKETLKGLLSELVNHNEFEISIASILYAIDVDISELYQTLQTTFKWEEIVECFVYIFENDPSYFQTAPREINSFFDEKPFPRYITAVCYSIIGLYFDKKAAQLKEPVWNNILNRNPPVIEPRVIFVVLEKLFEIDELLERSVQLLASENESYRFIGDTIIYMSGVKTQKIIKIIKQKLAFENDKKARNRYKRKICKCYLAFLELW